MLATGPGAVGNRTIGAAAAGGMIFGTVFGVIIVPGLYFLFAKVPKHTLKEEILDIINHIEHE